MNERSIRSEVASVWRFLRGDNGLSSILVFTTSNQIMRNNDKETGYANRYG